MSGIYIGGLQGPTADATVLLLLIVLTALVLWIAYRISHRD
jgi:hypothetical protein